MTSTQTSLEEVQNATYAKLTGDTTLMALITGVFDFGAVPTNQSFPYITLGDTTEGPLNAFAKRGYLSTLTLHIWSRAVGFKECHSILARMNTLLDQQTLSLATQHHVYTLYEASQSMNDPGLDNIRHMAIRYSTFTQEN